MSPFNLTQQRMAHSARIRNIFDLHIPISGPPNLEAVPLLGTNFGFALAEKNTADSTLQYHIQLVFKQSYTDDDISLPNCFVWAKRNPIRFQRSDETQEVEGIAVRIKLPPRVFDFRKYRSQQTRIQVNEIKNGQIIKQAFSNVVQILPKNRNGGTESTTIIPVFWVAEVVSTSPLSQLSPTASYVAESPADELSSPYLENGYNQSNYNQPIYNMNAPIEVYSEEEQPTEYPMQAAGAEMQYLGMNTNGEQYMVLYNGNAEVIGNFRALNFYKSSDINIKEDIRLLTEDYDCRDTLLQIDGVKYKFKQGVHPDTNRRFVGYIAQQVESVVPEAVQLIDGILHVDYESLIPYLSESIRANFTDINDLRSKTERIQKTIDDMYDQFIRKDSATKSTTPPPMHSHIHQSGSRTKKFLLLGIISVTVLVAIITALAFAGVIPLFSGALGDGPNPDSSGNAANEKFPPEFIVALKDLYTATNGDTWLFRRNWLDERVSICKWTGVDCHEEAHWLNETFPDVMLTVINIDLSYNNLNGTLPSSLYKITWLQRLELQNNFLTGTIPEEFSKIEKLKVLKLASNNLTGTLPNIAKYPALQEIDLSKNNFYGTIPGDFLNSEINNVFLAHNQLEGTIPDDGKAFLVKLDLSYNKLNGTLPFLGLNLEYINLSNNMLTGDVMAATRSRSLMYLNLANNTFNGHFSIPHYQLTKVVLLDISNNRFNSWRDVFNHYPDSLVYCDARNNEFECPFGSTWMENTCRAQCKD